jgi:hypothetical protein
MPRGHLLVRVPQLESQNFTESVIPSVETETSRPRNGRGPVAAESSTLGDVIPRPRTAAGGRFLGLSPCRSPGPGLSSVSCRQGFPSSAHVKISVENRRRSLSLASWMAAVLDAVPPHDAHRRQALVT